jgi:hypothetical protein
MSFGKSSAVAGIWAIRLTEGARHGQADEAEPCLEGVAKMTEPPDQRWPKGSFPTGGGVRGSFPPSSLHLKPGSGNPQTL